MADPLETVNKLIALATNNPNAEEARSAAFKAVQLIKASGFTVERAGNAARAPRMPSVDEFVSEVVRQQQDIRQRQQAAASSYYKFNQQFYPPFTKPGKGHE